MTADTVMTELSNWLGNDLTTSGLTPTRVMSDPEYQISSSDFPLIVMGLDPDAVNQFRLHTPGFLWHSYNLAVYVLVGAANTPLGQKHKSARQWPEEVGRSLYVWHQGHFNRHIMPGTPSDPRTNLMWELGDWDWADGRYFGIKFALPVSERLEVNA